MSTEFTLPSWPQYRYMSLEQKDQIYEQYCRAQGIDPAADSSADDFIEALPEVDNTYRDQR